MYDTDELYHYGVPGMKWGHRKLSQYYTKQANKQRSAASELRTAASVQRKQGNIKGANVLKGGVEISKQRAAIYQQRAKKHKELGKVSASKSISKIGSKKVKDLENWTAKDRYSSKNLTKSMSVNDMARAGYFGRAGRALAKKKKK